MSTNSTLGYQENNTAQTLDAGLGAGLERLCNTPGDGITSAPPEAGIERIEARFQGNGFSPHRHDTYAIGLTINGVQTFNYRGEGQASLPGQVIVIHPDELHDGGAGNEQGLRYRMIYVPPEKISDALAAGRDSGLPFVSSPVLTDIEFRQDLVEALSDIECEIGDLKRDCLLADLAACLKRHADNGKSNRPAVLDHKALKECSDLMKECCDRDVTLADLEAIAQIDRYSLARQFRRAYGTSPHRYLVMRRLDRVKLKLQKGEKLADAAVGSGFSDQSHMNRHFKRAFGMSPGEWRRLHAAGGQTL
ncbi:AraC family transcriptional regulator [Roseibium porphyridii]|uniref:AraC family transcriptional regulator n=1 Tax=Roseibium porphyridii TaxID=2866279 RepID=A0ABY8EYV0_9HYPH|nr:AraC family transcriptional regulator [Roseibium sp. KMA01]WFE88225.1 AraC family transcriptional regulator [Roseibium sp. KMA01]